MLRLTVLGRRPATDTGRVADQISTITVPARRTSSSTQDLGPRETRQENVVTPIVQAAFRDDRPGKPYGDRGPVEIAACQSFRSNAIAINRSSLECQFDHRGIAARTDGAAAPRGETSRDRAVGTDVPRYVLRSWGSSSDIRCLSKAQAPGGRRASFIRYDSGGRRIQVNFGNQIHNELCVRCGAALRGAGACSKPEVRSSFSTSSPRYSGAYNPPGTRDN